MRKITHYFSFSGRTSRVAYWRTQIPLLLFLGICWCAGFLLAESTGVDVLSGLGLIAALPVFWAAVALLFRRLHDRNKSGWWLVPFYLAPSILALIAKAMLDKGGTLMAGLAALGELTLWLWAFVELGLLSGTRGKNRFGPDPHATT